MKLYRIHAKQAVPISKETAWEFLSNPKNLQEITPKNMGFNILSGAEKSMFAGQIIQYRVAPFRGFSTTWVTEITHVEEGCYFVDDQRFGPYELWHHKHFIKVIDGGVILEDVIDYKIPFGIFGRLAQHLFVKKQLRTVFMYREAQLQEKFGKIDGFETELIIK